jgi:hypothetical protein
MIPMTKAKTKPTTPKARPPEAPPSTPNLSTKGEPIPAGHVEAFGGGFVKDTPAMKAVRKRWKKHDKPDGKKAFQAVADLEDPLADIERLVAVLYMIAGTEDIEERMQSALYHVANNLDDARRRADDCYSEIWNATWGFEFGEGRTQ